MVFKNLDVMKKEKRVKSKQDFQNVINSKFKVNSKCYVIHYKDNKFEYSRFGIAASKKLGGAIIRVKTRRQVRAMIDLLQKEEDILKKDYVIIVRNTYLNNDYLTNYTDLKNLINKIGGTADEKE